MQGNMRLSKLFTSLDVFRVGSKEDRRRVLKVLNREAAPSNDDEMRRARFTFSA